MVYGSIPAADAYFGARGSQAWAYAGSRGQDKQLALQRASDWIDATYGARFPGSKAGGRAQVRQWPRTGAADASRATIPVDAVPIEVEHATYEAAVRELVRPGCLSPYFDPGALVTSETIGPISTSYAVPSSAAAARPILAIVDGLLAGVLVSAQSATFFLARA